MTREYLSYPVGCKATHYVRLVRTWYAHHVPKQEYVEEIIIGTADDTPGPADIVLRWYDLTPGHPISPRLELFHDSWAWVTLWPEFFGWLAVQHGRAITPDAVEQQLQAWGLENVTQTRPESS